MATIIHDPTRGWLLLTPDGQIEIAKEDWDEIWYLPKGIVQDHHPYSVDAEFEVVTQQLRSDKWKPKEIARLVKAKEDIDVVATMTELMNHNPTESQDALWREVTEAYAFNDFLENMKKRFRIERI